MLTSNLLGFFAFLTFVCLGIIAFILIYLVIRGKQQHLFQLKVNRYVDCFEGEWYRYLITGGVMVKSVKNEVEKAAVDQIFTTYMTTINNREVRQRISEYAALYMESFYLKQLKSKDLAVRLNVMQRILLFDLAFLLPEVEKKLRQRQIKSTDEYILCLRFVSVTKESLFLAHMYKPRLKFRDYEYKVILSQVDEKYIAYFVEHFETAPIDIKLALLEYLSLSTNLDRSYLVFYEQQLQSVYKEIRIRSLKAIAAFGVLSHVNLYASFVLSEEWEERLMLAKILRFSTDEKAYQYLQQLIKDSNWKVRKQAALSLQSMREGIRILEQIIHVNDDRYATDMAKEILKVG